MLEREVRILFRKEWRQLLRSRGAMVSALLLPMILLVIVPGLQMVGLKTGMSKPVNLPSGVELPPGLREFTQDPMSMMRGMLVPFIALGGLIVPSVTASYILITERESRTLELLVALPVRVGQILLAKLLALLALASAVTLALFSIDAVLILGLGIGSPGFVLALLVMLLTAMAFSTTTALLVSLLARDFRTSNNINGLLIGPTILVCFAVMLVVPGPVLTALLLAALFSAGAAVATFVALKVITFERLLR
ncbi:ABC transporter permease subunit [Archangium minus]|uniref:ABC transporter permease subunit n=1 Tax=Archangium minus TaxID=83450 RepID=A0ABY9X6G5_9BACT|nr:ABC transporter permease subunit [Archangium minus]